MTTSERTITMRLPIPWSEESSEHLYRACRTQDTCWNLALEFLIKHPNEPLRKSKRLGVKGLQGHWLEWREEHEWAKKVPQAIWRSGVLQAKEQVERWETVDESHGKICLKALEEEKGRPATGATPVPRPAKALPPTQGPGPATSKYLHRRRGRETCRHRHRAHPRGRQSARARTPGRGPPTPELHCRRANDD